MSDHHGIGWAVKQLQDGKRVRRAGWNGKGMWLALVSSWSAAIGSPIGFAEPAACTAATKAVSGSPERGVVGWIMPTDWKGNLPFVAMYTATQEVVPWLCSQTDLLATDWEIAA